MGARVELILGAARPCDRRLAPERAAAPHAPRLAASICRARRPIRRDILLGLVLDHQGTARVRHAGHGARYGAQSTPPGRHLRLRSQWRSGLLPQPIAAADALRLRARPARGFLRSGAGARGAADAAQGARLLDADRRGRPRRRGSSALRRDRHAQPLRLLNGSATAGGL